MMACSSDHIELYSDIDSEYSDSQSGLNNGQNSRKSSDSNWGLDNGETFISEECYEVPLPRVTAPGAYNSTVTSGSSSASKFSSPSRYISQVYISSKISHRSKRHIRDSREYEQMPQCSRNLLEVINHNKSQYVWQNVLNIVSCIWNGWWW